MPSYRHTITISNPSKLREAVVFAENNGCAKEFAAGFTRLLSLISSFEANAESFGCELAAEIIPDGAPYSFAWWASRKLPTDVVPGKAMMNGGLIYHGPRDTGSGEAPAFSVALGRDAAKTPHEWMIHT